MRVVIQRTTTEAQVIVNKKVVGEISKGLVVFLGIEEEDSSADIPWLIKKIIQLRIFSDEQDKMNLSLLDVHGELLVISQFTLHASTKKGNRPSFIKSAKAEKGRELYELFVNHAKQSLTKVETGIFGADMKVKFINDGPVTIIIDSKQRE